MYKRRSPYNRLIWFIVSALAAVNTFVLNPPVRAQSPSSTQQENPASAISDDRQRARSAVDYLAELIPTIPRPANRVTGYALVGELLWRYDQPRARGYFHIALSTIDQVEIDSGSDGQDQPERQRQLRETKHQLRLQVLRCAAQLDRQLGRELIDQWKAHQNETPIIDESLDAHELIDLATMLVEDDPEEAAHLAQSSLDRGVSPDFGAFLQDLRQKDPESADQLFNTALKMTTQDEGTSLDALLSLINYAFPRGADEAGEQEPSIGSAQAGQLLDTLAAKLREPEPTSSAHRRTATDSELSSAERASLIGQHLPLFEQYSPEHVPALQSASERLVIGPPQAHIQSATSPAADHLSVESPPDQSHIQIPGTDQRTRDHLAAQAALSAAHQSEFDKAEQLLRQIQDSRLRQQALDLIHFETALQAIADDDFPRARRYAQDISQVKQRAAVYVMAAEKLARQGEDDRARFWINEASDFALRLKDSQEKIWTLFRLLSTTLRLDAPRGFDMGQSIVTALNQVRRDGNSASLTNALEQASLEEYITQAFGQLGRADFDRALYLAMQLQTLGTRILAELAICRTALIDNSDFSQP
ncbi:MAG: hypothetical protein HY314_06680 [Acidobacteria bacterium]|nr:hypothetical protein [Acidobacteriota bacterium]